MSDLECESTPVNAASKKRPLSSPFDYSETKKSLTDPMSSPDTVTADPVHQISLEAEDINAIAAVLKSSFHGVLEEMVKSAMTSSIQAIVDGVLSGLNARVTSLEKQNSDLVKDNERLTAENIELKGRMDDLELSVDGLEQYSRRNCLRISGVEESAENLNTDKVVLKLCKDVGVTLRECDIDRSHRVGASDNSKPRQIIVKFTSYRSRQILYRARANLRTSGNSGIYINEDLTKKRNKLLYDARQLVKRNIVVGAWTSDGVILVKDKDDRIHRVLKPVDLSRFN